MLVGAVRRFGLRFQSTFVTVSVPSPSPGSGAPPVSANARWLPSVGDRARAHAARNASRFRRRIFFWVESRYGGQVSVDTTAVTSSLDSPPRRSFGLRGCQMPSGSSFTSHARPTCRCPPRTHTAISKWFAQVHLVSGTTRRRCRGFMKAPRMGGDQCRIRGSSSRSTNRAGSMPTRTPMPTAATSSVASREGLAARRRRLQRRGLLVPGGGERRHGCRYRPSALQASVP
jgi:hypothetical protein